jgi:hypothetical protein
MRLMDFGSRAMGKPGGSAAEFHHSLHGISAKIRISHFSANFFPPAGFHGAQPRMAAGRNHPEIR